MKNQPRNEKGQFISSTIVPGRLYDFNGVTVRAGKTCNNGVRLVSLHKSLWGFAHDSELETISVKKVKKYLSKR